MNLLQLQTQLQQEGFYPGGEENLDGVFGPQTLNAIICKMKAGPDTPLAEQDFVDSAARLGVTTAHIKAITEVESAGDGFSEGLPKILFEPHRFSRATGHKYDIAYPGISSYSWNRALYPKLITNRYLQLARAVGLDVEAGFASASYGRFQILGENYANCGFASASSFAFAQSLNEAEQLKAFETFMVKTGIIRYLKSEEWGLLAKAYNGTAYKENHYDSKLEAAFRKFKE